jgi:hypothetical protein
MSHDPPSAYTFILRVWQERGAGEGGSDEWRGELRRVPDGSQSFFRTLATIPPLLARLLAGTTDPGSGDDG